ncbi:MAG: choice-of-anchor C family protein [Roseiarcus sp.]
MFRKMIVSAISLMSLLSVTSSACATNLIQNGSFEYGSDPGGYFLQLSTGSNAISDWTIGGTGIDYIGGYWTAADGYRSLDLSGSYDVGSVSQQVYTNLGQPYVVSFALAGNPDGNYTGSYIKNLAATVDALYGGLFSFSTANTSRTNMGWTEKSFKFVGDGKYDTITFASLNHSGYGPALDNVRMIAVPLAPSNAFVDLVAIAGFYVLIRRQSRRSNSGAA